MSREMQIDKSGVLAIKKLLQVQDAYYSPVNGYTSGVITVPCGVGSIRAMVEQNSLFVDMLSLAPGKPPLRWRANLAAEFLQDETEHRGLTLESAIMNRIKKDADSLRPRKTKKVPA